MRLVKRLCEALVAPDVARAPCSLPMPIIFRWPIGRTVAASASGFDLMLEPQALTVLRARYSR